MGARSAQRADRRGRLGSARFASAPRTHHPTVERSGRRDQVDPAGASSHEDLRAGGRRRPRGEHVVDQQDPRRDRTGRDERAPHRLPPLPAPPLGLWTRRDRTTEEPARGHTRAPAQPRRERPGLVVAPFRQAAPRQRYPRDRIDGRDRRGRHDRVGERRGDVAPSRELEPVHGRARGSLEQERRPCRVDRGWRTISTPRHRLRPGTTAALAPGGDQRDQPAGAGGTERPRSVTAARAWPGEDDVERAIQHRATVAATHDTPREGRSPAGSRRARRSSAAPACASPGTRRPRRVPLPRRTARPASDGRRRRPRV